MRIGRRLIPVAVIALAWFGLGAWSTQAAPDPQTGGGQLHLLEPIDSHLDATRPTEMFTFLLNEGQVISLNTQIVSGDLSVSMTLFDVAGKELAEGQEVEPSGVVIEAVIAPQAGKYSVVINRVGETAGAYTIMLLPGYSHLDRSDDFETGDPALSLNWETWSGDVSTGSLEEGRFRIHIEGNTITYTNPTDDLAWSDLYLQADVRVGDTPSFYEYGLAVRLNADNNEFYSLRFSSDNDWAADAYQGDWIRLQEWTVSPLIDLSDPNPTIGIYVHGDTLRLYFDHQFLGEVTDPQKMFSSGTVGLMAGTSTDQTDAVTVYFDNVVITTPAQAGGNVLSNGLTSIFGSATPIAGIQPSPTQSLGLPFGTPGATNTPKPTQTPTWTPQPPPAEGLVNWNSSSPAKIVSELQQAGVVPKGGDVSMTVPTTFGDTSDIGFSFYPLGQGRAFRNFVLGFDEHLDITGPGSGCGMFFRSSDTSSSDVLIFEDGTFLLGQFDSSGSLTANSVVDISPAVLTGRGAVNRVVVVAVEKEMRLYVNGELVAQGSSFMAGSGTLALEMYVNSDDVGNTQRTYCQLDNVWLWEF